MSEINKWKKLGASNEVDISKYKDVLDFAFEDGDIQNVALTGPNGAGKTSLLLTYMSNTNKEYIDISMAICADEKDTDTKNLEVNLINQIIYSVDDKVLEQSNINIGNGFKLDYSLIIYSIITFISIYIFFNSSNLQIYKEVIQIALGCISILSIYKILEILIKLNLNITLDTSILKVEASKEANLSAIDIYTNQLIQLIINSNKDYFVFQDLDRFDNTEIFVKLRRINMLVNKKLKNRVVKFVYIMKDDLFDAKTKVKFFDFIIPVVPVINYSNSEKYIVDWIIESKLDVRKVFSLKPLSNNIDDMRLFQNITNEFNVYNQAINSTNLNQMKLLAMIFYKNNYPNDYSKLYKRQSCLDSFFEFKRNYLKTELLKLGKIKYEEEFEAKKQIERKFTDYLLSENIMKDVIDKYFAGDEFNNRNRLVYQFILLGFIDETYVEYTSYFADTRLTENDKNFIRGMQRVDTKFDIRIKIDNPKTIITRHKLEMNNISILNLDLIKYLNSLSAKELKNIITFKKIYEQWYLFDENLLYKIYYDIEESYKNFIHYWFNDYPYLCMALNNVIEGTKEIKERSKESYLRKSVIYLYEDKEYILDITTRIVVSVLANASISDEDIFKTEDLCNYIKENIDIIKACWEFAKEKNKLHNIEFKQEKIDTFKKRILHFSGNKL